MQGVQGVGERGQEGDNGELHDHQGGDEEDAQVEGMHDGVQGEGDDRVRDEGVQDQVHVQGEGEQEGLRVMTRVSRMMGSM
jgi:hypothetical protein